LRSLSEAGPPALDFHTHTLHGILIPHAFPLPTFNSAPMYYVYLVESLSDRWGKIRWLH
jgi:hypothetical protein